MDKDNKKKIQLGLLVLGSLALFISGIFFIGSRGYMFSNTLRISALFNNAAGVRKGDYVWLSGVNVGVVENISFVSDSSVKIDMQISKDAREHITKEAVASISTEGLVGNKLIVIYPGKIKGTIVNENDTIKSIDPLDMSDLMRRLVVIGDDAATLIRNLAAISMRIDTGSGLLSSIIKDTALSMLVQQSVANTRAASHNLIGLVAGLSAFTGKLNSDKGLISSLTNDTLINNQLRQAIYNLETVSKSSENVINGLALFSSKLNEGEGALDVLLSDSTFAKNLETSMANIRNSSQKLDRNMEALQHNFLLRGFFKKENRKKKK